MSKYILGGFATGDESGAATAMRIHTHYEGTYAGEVYRISLKLRDLNQRVATLCGRGMKWIALWIILCLCGAVWAAAADSWALIIWMINIAVSAHTFNTQVRERDKAQRKARLNQMIIEAFEREALAWT